MPSIAQQDYLRPSGKSVNDCHLLAALAHNLEQGTIFDSLISFVNRDDEGVCVRPLQVTEEARDIYFYDSFNDMVFRLSVRHTQIQYDGLASIQDAAESWNNLPQLAVGRDREHLEDSGAARDYLTIDGKGIIPTVEQGLLTAITIDEEASMEGVEISWEDAQKLIGLPCAG